MWSLGMEGGAARRNWAIPVGDSAGEGWRRKRGSPTTGLWPRIGGGAPAAGQPAARREHGRGGPPVCEEARATQGCCRGHVEFREGGGLRQNEP
jgi:hypothetical protein